VKKKKKNKNKNKRKLLQIILDCKSKNKILFLQEASLKE